MRIDYAEINTKNSENIIYENIEVFTPRKINSVNALVKIHEPDHDESDKSVLITINTVTTYSAKNMILPNINFTSADEIPTYVFKLGTLLYFITVEHPHRNECYKLLIDSGAQINVIKAKHVSLNLINNKIQVLLSGISDKVIRTMSVVKIPICDINVDFHIVPDNFAIPFDGIIGVKLLTEQKLRLDKGYLQINNSKFTINSDNNLINKKKLIIFRK